jgi:chloride channel 7
VWGAAGGFILFEVREGQVDYQLYELLPMTLLGMVGGLLGASFNALSARLCTWRR